MAGRWLPLTLVLTLGCGAGTAEIPRILDGEPARPTPFVSPHQYEWFVRGELALAENDLDRAAAAFEQARLGPDDDALVVVRLAETERRRGRLDRAMDLVRTAKALDPASEGAFLVEGAVEETRHQDEAAQRAYESAIAVAPRSPLGPLALAALHVRLGRGPLALEVLTALATRAEGSLAADRARFEIALAVRDPEALIAATRAFLARSPGAEERVLEALRALLETDAALVLRVLGDDVSPSARTLRLEALARAHRVPELETALAMGTEPQEEAARLFLVAGDPARALTALDGARDEAARCVRKRVLEALGRAAEAARIEGCAAGE